jgi:hypothetical protein
MLYQELCDVRASFRVNNEAHNRALLCYCCFAIQVVDMTGAQPEVVRAGKGDVSMFE